MVTFPAYVALSVVIYLSESSQGRELLNQWLPPNVDVQPHVWTIKEGSKNSLNGLHFWTPLIIAGSQAFSTISVFENEENPGTRILALQSVSGKEPAQLAMIVDLSGKRLSVEEGDVVRFHMQYSTLNTEEPAFEFRTSRHLVLDWIGRRPQFDRLTTDQRLFKFVLPTAEPSEPEEFDANFEIQSGAGEFSIVLHTRLSGSVVGGETIQIHSMIIERLTVDEM